MSGHYRCCLAIDTTWLRKRGMFSDWMTNRINRKWCADGEIIANVFLTTDFTGAPHDSQLKIAGTCFAQPVRQTVRLVAKPMRFGGKRWYFICPITGRRCCKVILHPRGAEFASIKAWGVTYDSQHEDAMERSHKKIEKIQHRIGLLSTRTRASSREKLQKRLMGSEDYLAKLDEHATKMIVSGKRLSLRKAARLAKNSVAKATSKETLRAFTNHHCACNY